MVTLEVNEEGYEKEIIEEEKKSIMSFFTNIAMTVVNELEVNTQFTLQSLIWKVIINIFITKIILFIYFLG
jgi:hypothetical protein